MSLFSREIGMSRIGLLASPSLTLKTPLPVQNWILGFETLEIEGRDQLARTASVCLQLPLLPVHTPIYSGRMTWMMPFSFLAPIPTALLAIHPANPAFNRIRLTLRQYSSTPLYPPYYEVP